jgi:hypothetical protein
MCTLWAKFNFKKYLLMPHHEGWPQRDNKDTNKNAPRVFKVIVAAT